jgi:hypothetical protein
MAIKLLPISTPILKINIETIEYHIKTVNDKIKEFLQQYEL